MNARRRNKRRFLPNFKIISVILFAGAIGLFVRELMAFSRQTDLIPSYVSVGGIDVGGRTGTEARLALERAYSQPVLLYYGNSPILLDPSAVGFRVNAEVMVTAALGLTDAGGSFWIRFFNHLAQQELQPETANIPLNSDYQQNLLRSFLEDIARRYDQGAGAPMYDVATLTTFVGEQGAVLDINQAITLIDEALKSPDNRTVVLPITGSDSERPSLDTLEALLIDYLDTNGFIYDGQTTTAGIFVMDLQTGEEMSILGDVAFSAASTQKISIMLDYFRYLSTPPTQDDAWLLANSMLCSENSSSNVLMEVIGGGNIFNGIASVTRTMQQAGARNSFLSAPFQEPGRELGSIAVPATRPNPSFNTHADSFNQATAEDVGTLLTMIYDCANYSSGLVSAFDEGAFTQQECRQMLNLMSANDLERLLQGGIPEDVTISHKNGWLNHQAVVSDAGIVFSPSGRDYVISVFLWKETTQDQATLVGFTELWPLLEDISRATWNHFNPDQVMMNRRELPEQGRDCVVHGYRPPYGQVDLDNINGWRENN
jgi:beta-lactamase class A